MARRYRPPQWILTDNNGWTVARFARRSAAERYATRIAGPLWLEEFDPETGEYFPVRRLH